MAFDVRLPSFFEILRQNDATEMSDRFQLVSEILNVRAMYRFFRTACIPASWQIAAISAAETLSGREIKSSRSTSSERLILAVMV